MGRRFQCRAQCIYASTDMQTLLAGLAGAAGASTSRGSGPLTGNRKADRAAVCAISCWTSCAKRSWVERGDALQARAEVTRCPNALSGRASLERCSFYPVPGRADQLFGRPGGRWPALHLEGGQRMAAAASQGPISGWHWKETGW